MIRFALSAWLIIFSGAYVAWGGPLTIQSNHLDIWHKKHQALFTGKVHLTRDDFELFCDKLRVFYIEGSGIDHAEATGHVRIRQGDKHGHADKADLDNKKHILTLIGHAVMEQPEGTIEGEIIIHNIQKKTTEVRQGKNQRVKLHMNDQNSSKAPPGKTASEALP